MSHDLVAKVKELHRENGHVPTKSEMYAAGISDHALRGAGGMNRIVELAGFEPYNGGKSRIEQARTAKILVLDIETTPIEAFVWGLFDQNIGLSQIKDDWSVMCWAAKWVGSSEVFFEDVRNRKSLKDDKQILKSVWNLLNEADWVVSQNGKKFDSKKLNARFIKHGFKPPSSYRHFDILQVGRKHFAFTSHKLAYKSDELCTEHKKLAHAKFPGFELWRECMKRNPEAWEEMKLYNVADILATEELFFKFAPWERSFNLNVYRDDFKNECSCGSDKIVPNEVSPFYYTQTGRFERLVCQKCGKEHVKKENLLSKEKRRSLMK